MAEINSDNYEAFLLDYSEGQLSAENTADLYAFLMQHPELGIGLDDLKLPVLPDDRSPVDFKQELKKDESHVADEAVLNYLEGMLSGKQKTDFENKIAQDAELSADLKAYEQTILAVEASFIFEDKARLLKTEEDLLLNDRVIAYAEGQLPAAEKAEFEQALLNDATLQKEFQLVLKTKAVADLSIVYPDKAGLKKENKVIALFSFRTLGAVAAAILLLIGLAVIFNTANEKPLHTPGLADKKEYVKPVAGTKAISKQPAEANSGKELPVKALAGGALQQQAGIQKATMDRQQASRKENKKQNSFIEKTPALETAVAKEEQAKEQSSKQESATVTVEPTPSLAKNKNSGTNNNAPVTANQSPAIATGKTNSDSSALNSKEIYTHQTFLATVEDKEDDLIKPAAPKNGFWQRMAHLARRANQLGMKAVDGEEKSTNDFFVSFHSFSVEKK